jgi:lysophospholipase L1-like esterase
MKRPILLYLLGLVVALVASACSSPAEPAAASPIVTTTIASTTIASTTIASTTTFAPLLEQSTTEAPAIESTTTTVVDENEESPIEIETALADGDVVDTYVVQFNGSVDPGVDVEVNGEAVIVESNGSFSVPVRSQIGANEVVVVATGEVGNETVMEIGYTFEPPEGWISALGDSVMLGAAEEVEARFGEGIVDATVSRQFRDSPASVKELLARENPPQVIIIGLGTNGAVSDEQFDDTMFEAAEVPMVAFVNVRVPRDWEAPTNAVLAAGVERWDNAILIDWFTPADPDDSYFAADGFHPSLTGRVLYSDLVSDAIFPTGDPIES